MSNFIVSANDCNITISLLGMFMHHLGNLSMLRIKEKVKQSILCAKEPHYRLKNGLNTSDICTCFIDTQ